MMRAWWLAGLLLVGVARAQPGPQSPGIPARPTIPKSGIIPAIHLAKSRAAGTSARYCILGDSTGTIQFADNVTPSDLLWGKLKQRIQQDERAAGYALTDANFLNFAIGGTTLGNVVAGQVGGSSPLAVSYPSFWTVHTNTWLSYLQAANCTTVILNTGVNDPGYETAANFLAAYQQLTAWTTIPDLIFVTNAVANIAAGAPYNTTAFQDGLLANAGLQRTLASSGNKMGTAIGPIGVIDIGRYFNQAVLGRDPAQQALSYVVPPASPVNGITAFPYSFGLTPGGDFALSITFPGLGAAMNTAGSVVTISLADGLGGTGGFAATQVNFQTTDGARAYANYYFNGAASINASQSPAWASGDVNLIVSAQGDHMVFYVNNVVIQDIIAPRIVGPFNPTISFTNPPGGLTMNVVSYAVGTPKAVAPTINPAACYGIYLTGASSGNGINHDSSVCLNQAYFPVLEATQF